MNQEQWANEHAQDWTNRINEAKQNYGLHSPQHQRVVWAMLRDYREKTGVNKRRERFMKQDFS